MDYLNSVVNNLDPCQNVKCKNTRIYILGQVKFSLGWLILHFGMVLGWYWDGTGTVLGRYWDGTGTVLGRYWDSEEKS